ncbi:MAG TPA: hypothetical protein VGO48_06790 [Conexibacter sp.]|jgi:hypothetical protein|nr:hypothetical protein [Conexibacter sp.]
MGRRSRQRASAPQRERVRTPTPPPPVRASTPAAAPSTTAARRSRRDNAPKPPWGSFPLIELCALSAIALGVWGVLAHNGVLLTGAAFLGSVAGLEVALREHLGGFRSHTLVLTGTVTVATLALLLLAGVTRTTVFIVGPAMLILGFVGFRQLFKRRSGGAGMRVR